MKLRNDSRPVTYGDVAKYIDWTKPDKKQEPRNMQGLCACGREIVPRFEYRECGKEKHARARCIVGGVHISGARW